MEAVGAETQKFYRIWCHFVTAPVRRSLNILSLKSCADRSDALGEVVRNRDERTLLRRPAGQLRIARAFAEEYIGTFIGDA